jgi:hypothetical protein
MKRAAGLLLVAGLLAVGLAMITRPAPAPALAAGKPLFLGPFLQEGEALLAECGTFQALDAYEGELSITAFLDNEGNPERAIVDFHGTDTFRNSVTGKSFSEPFHNKEFDQLNGDLQPDQVTKVGVGVRLTIPGRGAVLLEVGRVVERPGSIDFEAGPHQLLDGDVAGLCAALA